MTLDDRFRAIVSRKRGREKDAAHQLMALADDAAVAGDLETMRACLFNTATEVDADPAVRLAAADRLVSDFKSARSFVILGIVNMTLGRSDPAVVAFDAAIGFNPPDAVEADRAQRFRARLLGSPQPPNSKERAWSGEAWSRLAAARDVLQSDPHSGMRAVESVYREAITRGEARTAELCLRGLLREFPLTIEERRRALSRLLSIPEAQPTFLEAVELAVLEESRGARQAALNAYQRASGLVKTLDEELMVARGLDRMGKKRVSKPTRKRKPKKRAKRR